MEARALLVQVEWGGWGTGENALGMGGNGWDGVWEWKEGGRDGWRWVEMGSEGLRREGEGKGRKGDREEGGGEKSKSKSESVRESKREQERARERELSVREKESEKENEMVQSWLWLAGFVWRWVWDVDVAAGMEFLRTFGSATCRMVFWRGDVKVLNWNLSGNEFLSQTSLLQSGGVETGNDRLVSCGKV